MAKGQREQLLEAADGSAERELANRLEVRSLKRYAIIRGYTLKAMKLLGYLALLWSTVVLLGGFVTLLKRKDFWDLTFIGFLQAAGLFNMAVDDVKSFQTMIHMLASWRPRCKKSNFVARILFLLKIALFVICYVPVVVVMVLAADGPIVCFGISLGRLRMRDYGSDDGDVGKSNLTPALDIFYSLSAAQGALFLLCVSMEIGIERDMVWAASRQLGFSYEVISGYLHETKRECAKLKPSSTESWNLYTYATGLLDSEMPEDYCSGARVLNELIEQEIPFNRMLIRSPRHRIEKLIRALNWTSPADRETRGLAARIVAHLAADLDLSQFPGALECILPLLNAVAHNRSDQEALHLPSRNRYQEPVGWLLELLIRWLVIKIQNLARKNGLMQDIKQQMVQGKPNSAKGTNEDLILQGLRILENLAHSEHNCSVIYSTKGLLSTISGPVSSDKLISDRDIDVAWMKVLDASLRVVVRLMEAPGDTGKGMRLQFAGNRKAVENLEAVLGLKGRGSILELQTKAMDILAQLFSDESTCTSEDRRDSFINKVLQIFTSDEWMEYHFKGKRDEEITSQSLNDNVGPSYKQTRRTALQEKMMNEAQETARKHKEMAGKALSMLSKGNQSNSKVINDFKECRNIIACLAEILGSRTKTIQCSLSATETSIIEIKTKTEWRVSAADILKHLCAHTKVDNEDKKALLKKLLEEMLNEKTEQGAGARSSRDTSPATIKDVENLPPPEDRMLQAALLSLYAEIHATWTDAGYFARVVHDIAGEGFVGKLKAVVEDNSYATPACLSMLKIACEMVKLFIQCNHYINEIKKEKIIDALSEASKAMSEVESCLLFTGVVNDCYGVPVLPLSSALVEQARVLLANAPESANAAPAEGPERHNACRCVPPG